MVTTVSSDGRELFQAIHYLSPPEQQQVRAAFEYACAKHADQIRKSGEPFHTHPATVAYCLAQYRLDASALIAALLHDVAEDTGTNLAEIEQRFGRDVRQLVDGVTKFEQSADDAARFGELSREELNIQTLTKLFRSMTRDVSVVLIKLFDRLHNMRTIESMPLQKGVRTARETLNVYAPLANRLGIWQLKTELENLSFEVLNEDDFRQIDETLKQRQLNQKTLTQRAIVQVERSLQQFGIQPVRIELSPHNPFSIYRQAKRQGNWQYIIDDVPRLVIVVSDLLTCYAVLGVVHATWPPKPHTFDDYIARPRENLYRALHTTLLYDGGQPIKIRIRTEAMSIVSEIGVLANWANVAPQLTDEVTSHVNQLLNSIRGIEQEDAHDVVERVVADVLSVQIRAYTPHGEVKELPSGATALDFAYKIHTDVGDTCRAALVNDVLMPLNVPLQDGDRVLIRRHSESHPHRIWLDEDLGFLHTANARSHVRRWFRNLSDPIATRQGQTLLDAELTMIGLPAYPHEKIAQWMGYETSEKLYLALGRAEILQTEVSRRVLAESWHTRQQRQIGQVLTAPSGEKFIIIGASLVSEHLHLCRNCAPRPGEPIRGYIRSNKGVTVHRESCHQLAPDMMADRLLQLRWGEETVEKVKPVEVHIEVHDRPNLLYEITDMLREEHINIAWINTPRGQVNMRVDLVLEFESPRQLVGLLHRLRTLVNVRSVRCVSNNKSAS